jgi:hypothetical protein
MKSLRKERKIAISMRENGKTYSEIRNAIHVSNGSLSIWLRTYNIDTSRRSFKNIQGRMSCVSSCIWDSYRKKLWNKMASAGARLNGQDLKSCITGFPGVRISPRQFLDVYQKLSVDTQGNKGAWQTSNAMGLEPISRRGVRFSPRLLGVYQRGQMGGTQNAVRRLSPVQIRAHLSICWHQQIDNLCVKC